MVLVRLCRIPVFIDRSGNASHTREEQQLFLPVGKKFAAGVYYDDPKAATRTKVGIKKIKVDHKTKLAVRLPSSCGQAIRLVAVN
jgi:alpha-glucosidase